MKKTWPSDQSADSVETQTPDEDGFVAIVSKDPVGMAKRSEWVCTWTMFSLRATVYTACT